MRRPESDTLPAVAVATQQNSVKEIAESCTHPKEVAANLLHTMPNGLSDGFLHLTKTSATKAGGWPDSATNASRPGSAKNDGLREKRKSQRNLESKSKVKTLHTFGSRSFAAQFSIM